MRRGVDGACFHGGGIALAETAGRLQRQLDGTSIGLLTYGAIIGSGLFLASAVVLRAAGAFALFSYALGAALAAIELAALAEMAAASPVPGAFATLARRVWGESAGDVAGYLYFLSGVVGMASEAVATGLLARTLLPVLPLWLPTLGLAALAYLLNRLSVALFGRLESLASVVKALAIAAFLLALLTLRLVRPRPPVALHGSWQGAFYAMPAVFFAYSGTGVMALAAPEARNPLRDIPRALWVSAGLVAGSYILSIAGVLLHVPWHAIRADRSPMVQALAAAGLPTLGSGFDLLLVFVTFATLSTGIYTSARMLAALAAAGKVPRGLGQLSRAGVPTRAVLGTAALLGAVAALTFVLPDTVFALLVNTSGDLTLATWIFVMATHLRMRRNRPLPFRLPGFPWTDYAGIAAVGAVAVLAALSPLSRPGLVLAAALVAVAAAAVTITSARRSRQG